jgi:hypothetical protein
MALSITCGITFDIFKGEFSVSYSQSIVSVVQRIERRDQPRVCQVGRGNRLLLASEVKSVWLDLSNDYGSSGGCPVALQSKF